MFCFGIHATANDAAPVFACNLKAIPAADRHRYSGLVKRVRAAVTNRREVADGYAYQLDHQSLTLSEAAEWMGMERLCCPFLTFQLTVSGKQSSWLLTLTGPEGIKPLLDAEFPR